MEKRFFELREHLNISQEDMGNRIGVTKSTISLIERGQRNASDRVIRDICREFNVDENWLRTGEGEMFKDILEDDETAALVSDLIEDNNPFFDIILDIMRTYNELDPKSQDALIRISDKFKEIVARKKQS